MTRYDEDSILGNCHERKFLFLVGFGERPSNCFLLLRPPMKKNVYFWALPKLALPLSHSGHLVLFFRMSKTMFCSYDGQYPEVNILFHSRSSPELNRRSGLW